MKPFFPASIASFATRALALGAISFAAFSPSQSAFAATDDQTSPPAKTSVTNSTRIEAPITRSNAAVSGGVGTNSTDTNSPTNTLGPLTVDLSRIRRVKVAGTIVSDAPIRVGNLDVLAPIVGDDSSLLSQLGATASRVSQQNIPGNINAPTNAQSFQLNLSPRAPIVLTVGQSVAYVNGQEQQLRAAPLVIGGKIWLPVFSIAPLLGAAVRLQPDGTLAISPTVQSVEIFPVGKNIALTVQLSAPLPEDRVLVGTDNNPEKVYFDFSGFAMGFDAANSTGERTVSTGLGDVKQIRAGMPQTSPDITRVVLDLNKKIKYVVQPTADRTVFAILIGNAPVVRPTPKAGTPRITPVPTPVYSGDLRGLTIVVDAGHGGHDSGAPGRKSYEKNHTLDISKRLRNHLEARGATVLMTRDSDIYIPLQGRTDFANSRRADIFVSVHIDSFKSTSAGTTTHFTSATSLPLAREVQKELAKATGLNNRGTKQSRFFVIRKTWMPSILAEVAFISNPREEALLVNAAWRERVARGLAQGVSNYVAKYGVN